MHTTADGLTSTSHTGTKKKRNLLVQGIGANAQIAGNGSAYNFIPNTNIGNTNNANTVPFSQRQLLFSSSTQKGFVNTTHGNLLPGSSGYLGFSFNSSGATPNYGWANISVNNDASVTLRSFGYEQTPGVAVAAGNLGTPLTATAAPDANPLLLLLTGGPVALAMYRNQRRKETVQ